MNIDVLCMERAEGRIDIFLVRTQKKLVDPITDLQRYYPERDYIRGYSLSDVNINAVGSGLMSWNNYNSSLRGIWHHPSFPEILDTMKSNSEFLFNVPEWCYAEMKDTRFINYI